jgi:hypothetical protein
MDIDVVTVKSTRQSEDNDAAEIELKELLEVVTRDVRKEIKEHDAEMMAVVRSLGGSAPQYRRERQKALKAAISEIYSPPRVAAAAKLLPELRIIPGFSLNLTVADHEGRRGDFDGKEMRDRARKKVIEERPMLLVGSPMCTAFSTWQRINNKIRCPVTVAAELKRAKEHLTFCVELYRLQARGGRSFMNIPHTPRCGRLTSLRA